MHTVHTIATKGLQPIPITIELTATSGIPEIVIVGMADKTIVEAKDRVVTALKHCGVKIKARKIIINLQPAELKKSGNYYDLAIAVGLLNLLHHSQIPVKDTVFFGGLSLDGSLQPVSQIITKVLAAKQFGYTTVFVPHQNSIDAARVTDITIKKLHSISQLLSGVIFQAIPSVKHTKAVSIPSQVDTPFDSLQKQEHVKRAVMLAIAGHHHLLVVGPPGVGKTSVLLAAQSLVPPLTETALLETLSIHEAAGLPLTTLSSIRNPSPHSSHSQFFGNSRTLQPGEVSLAHQGILFLDEIALCSAQVMSKLRKVLDEKKSVILNRTDTAKFPADFILLAATNPCPCGYWQTQVRACKCSQAQRASFEKKLSGPLLDRIDIKINSDSGHPEATPLLAQEARTLISQAHQKQRNRYHGSHLKYNSNLRLDNYIKFCEISTQADTTLNAAIARYRLSYRSIEKVIGIAQTIADVSNQQHISAEHIKEALSYRFEQQWNNPLG